MTAGSSGARREHQVRRFLEADGWVVVRAAGSLGPVDLVAMHRGRFPMFVQVKADRRSAWHNFPPEDRLELAELARQAGAEAWLAWYPQDRRPAQWIPERDWPTTRQHQEARP